MYWLSKQLRYLHMYLLQMPTGSDAPLIHTDIQQPTRDINHSILSFLETCLPLKRLEPNAPLY